MSEIDELLLSLDGMAKNTVIPTAYQEYTEKAATTIRQLQAERDAIRASLEATSAALAAAVKRADEAWNEAKAVLQAYITDLEGDYPKESTYDNGHTTDGWRQALARMSGYLETAGRSLTRKSEKP